MIFTISTVARSLADHLGSFLPDFTFYEDPNQQGTKLPCAFLQQRYSHIVKKQANRWLRTLGLDLTCLEDYNLPDIQRRYQRTAEILDQALETFLYSDGTESTLVRAYGREWRIDLDALHYKFELRVWVKLPEEFNPMRTMDYEEVVDGG